MKNRKGIESAPPTGTSEPSLRRSSRGLRFTVLCVVCFFIATTYVIYTYTLRHSTLQGLPIPQGVSKEPLANSTSVKALHDRPYMIFRNTALGDKYGSLGLAPLEKRDGPRTMVALHCERVHFSAGKGVCLTANRGVFTTYEALVFDADFQPLHTLPLGGVPSRVRVSPDGRFAAITVFINGHSYAVVGFSTLTTIIDLHSGKALVDNLEKFTVWRDGKRIHAVDFNFWGVTFTNDSEHFYATLGTGGQTYLVKGDITTRKVRVLRDNIECPSLSPDNSKIAFKKKIDTGFGPIVWRLSVLDLSTAREWPLAETRSVDDQAEWLDDHHILFSLPDETSSAAVTNTWVVQADGDGQPHILMPETYSLVVVREERLSTVMN